MIDYNNYYYCLASFSNITNNIKDPIHMNTYDPVHTDHTRLEVIRHKIHPEPIIFKNKKYYVVKYYTNYSLLYMIRTKYASKDYDKICKKSNILKYDIFTFIALVFLWILYFTLFILLSSSPYFWFIIPPFFIINFIITNELPNITLKLIIKKILRVVKLDDNSLPYSKEDKNELIKELQRVNLKII